MEIVSSLIDIKTPPKGTSGYYGVVLKPKYIPLWIAKIFKNRLKVREGWLNMPYTISRKGEEGWDERWWFYKSGDDFIKCYPIFWCKIKTYYKAKVIPNGNHPFAWRVEDPEGSYKIHE
jgi:hypothetical protein